MQTFHTVQDVMTTDVVTVGRHTAFKDIAGLFDQHRISAVPVVDAQRHVLGVVSEADLLARQTEPGHRMPITPNQRRRHTKAAGCRAHELMTAPAVTVGADADVVTAARLLQRHGVKRLPVLDAAGVLVGIVSRRDLLRVFLRTDHDIAART
jgi:CBS-domain-containing membrane protein